MSIAIDDDRPAAEFARLADNVEVRDRSRSKRHSSDLGYRFAESDHQIFDSGVNPVD